MPPFVPQDAGSGQIPVLDPQGNPGTVAIGKLSGALGAGFHLDSGSGQPVAPEMPVSVLSPANVPGAVPYAKLASALSSGFALDTGSQQERRAEVEKYGGAGQGAAAFGEGALRTLLPGGGGQGLEEDLLDNHADQAARAKMHPWMAGAGGVAGIAPWMAASLAAGPEGPAVVAGGAPGLFSAAGEGATALAGLEEGGIAAKLLAGATEGSLYTASNAYDQNVLMDHPNTAAHLAADAGLGFVGGGLLSGGLQIVGAGLKAGTRAAMEHVFEQTTGVDLGEVAQNVEMGPNGKDGLVDALFRKGPEAAPAGVMAPSAEELTSRLSSAAPMELDATSSAAKRLQDVLREHLPVGESYPTPAQVVTSGQAASHLWERLLGTPGAYTPDAPLSKVAMAMSKELPDIYGNALQSPEGETGHSLLRTLLADSWSEGAAHNIAQTTKGPVAKGLDALTPLEQKATKSLMSAKNVLAALAVVTGHPGVAAADLIGGKLQQKLAPGANRAALQMGRFLGLGGDLAGKGEALAVNSPLNIAPEEVASKAPNIAESAITDTPVPAGKPGPMPDPSSPDFEAWVAQNNAYRAAQAKPAAPVKGAPIDTTQLRDAKQFASNVAKGELGAPGLAKAARNEVYRFSGDPERDMDTIVNAANPKDATNAYMEQHGMSGQTPEGKSLIGHVRSVLPPGTSWDLSNAPHPVIPFQQDALHNLTTAAARAPEEGLDMVKLGKEIISTVQGVDRNAKQAAETIVTGKGAPETKALPAELELPKGADSKAVASVREYLQEAQAKLIKSGSPALAGVGSAVLTQLLNALPSPGLAQMDPNGPGQLGQSKWVPPAAQVRNYQQVAEALNNPIGTLAKVGTGSVSTPQLQAIGAVYPSLLASVQGKVSAQVRAMGDKKLPLDQQLRVRRFLSNGQDVGISPATLAAITMMPTPQMPQPGASAGKPKAQGQKLKLGQSMATQTQKASMALNDQP